MTASKTTWLAAMAAVTLLAGTGPADAGGDKLECRARLTGAQEVPPIPDPVTSGRFEIEFNKRQTEGEFKLRVSNGTDIGRAHLHCAAKGVNGPIVVFLVGDFPFVSGTAGPRRGVDVDGTWLDNSTIKDSSVVPLAADANPACPGGVSTLASVIDQALAGRIYVNVHDNAFPGGVARGQLRCDDGDDDDDRHHGGGDHKH